MSKKKFKKYSVAAKLAYHTKRSKSYYDRGEYNYEHGLHPTNKQYYSHEWLEGYNDPNARTNIFGIENKIKQAKKGEGAKHRDYMAGLYGYRNGLKARVGKTTREDRMDLMAMNLYGGHYQNLNDKQQRVVRHIVKK